jgi:anaerobic selenocysteine-containing dehydrogenase
MAEWKTVNLDGSITYRTCAWSPPGCHPVGCGLLVHVKGDKVTKIEGDPEHSITRGALCSRCLALPEYMYHPDRIIYPMKRSRENRGLDKWEQCSWDEAIDLIVSNAKKVSDQYGPESIAVFGGTGREGNDYYSTFANCVFGTPNAVYAQPGWSCYGPRASITAFMMGGGYPEIDYAQKCAGRYEDPRFTAPKCIVLWGKEPLRSNPDGLFGHSVVEMMQQFGTKVIMVDPRMTWIGTRAEYVLQLRPGTDTAMAMAWINVIAEEGLYDQDFVEKWTYGFDEMVAACAEMTPEHAAEICGVSADEIRSAARLYANSHPSSLCWGLAVDQNPNGVQLGQCLLALMAITGDLDAPGGTLLGAGDPHASNAARSESVGDADEGRDKDDYADRAEEVVYANQMEIAITYAYQYGLMTEERYAKKIGVDKYPAIGAIMWTVAPDEFLKALETGKPYEMHMAMIQSSNPVGSAISGEPQRWHNALKKLDFNFCTDLFMNPTIMSCCDVFLPLATTVEHDAIVVPHYSLNMSFFGAERKCVQVGECKSEMEILLLLGKRMFPQYWGQFEDETDYIRKKSGKLDWDNLCKEVIVTNEEPYYKYKSGELRADGQPGFPTQTGRVELYSYTYESFGESPLPFNEEPAYGPISTPELMKDFPFVLTTGARRQEFFHSEHKQVPSLRKISPWPEMDINPADAAELGIEEGDWVEMASPYGTCRQRAKVTPTIKQGVLHAMHGWSYPEESGEEPSLFGNWRSNINTLMPNSVNGKLGFGDTFKCMICSAKKVDGPGNHASPSEDEIYVEPSRAAEFTLAQTWRPATAPEYSQGA